MTQYNSLNVKLSNSQLNKLISGIKIETEVTLNFSLSMIGNSNDETNFLRKLLINDWQGKFKDYVKLLRLIHQLIKIIENSAI